MSEALSVLVLSEDGSPLAFTTIQAIARKLLQFVDRHTATHRIRFEPGDEKVAAVKANRWQSKKPRDRQRLVDLRRELATKILEDDVPGYVLFHFDGDTPWSRAGQSSNARAFEVFVRSVSPLVKYGLERRGVPADEQAVEQRLQRICPIVPHYSIEAWLYQNTELLRDACRKHGGRHLEVVDRWEHDRSLLDEEVKPKEKIFIGSTKNAELAESLTSDLADRIYELGQSFHATVERLEACPGIAEALASTWQQPSSGVSAPDSPE